MFKKFQNLFFVLLLAALGFVSGILGSLYIENNLLELNASYDKYIQKNDTYQKNELIFLNDNKNNFSMDYFEKSIVGIVKIKDQTNDISSNFYTKEDIIGYGFVLTNDGWIVALADMDEQKNNDLAVLNDNQIFSFEKKALDPCTGILFLKVDANEKKFTTVKLGNSDKIKLFDKIISIDLLNNAFEEKITNIGKIENFIQSSEKLEKRIIINRLVGLGLPFVNQYGEVIGIVSKTDKNSSELIPINYFKNQINNLLKTGELKRIFLGINYIDLSKTLQNSKIKPEIKQQKGALIYDSQKVNAIKAKSPAEKAGLQYNDLILSIESEDLGINKSLNEIIQEYKVGSEIEMEILRKGKVGKINVKLEEL